MVLGREMRGQEAQRRQGYRSLGQALEDDRQPPGQAGRLDAPVRGVLREMEYTRAVHKERRIARGQVQAPPVELREVRDKGGRRLPLVPGEALHLRGQLGVREPGRRG